MLTRCINTHEYDADIKKLLTRRLEQTGYPFTLDSSGSDFMVSLKEDDPDMLEVLCVALAMLLCRDLRHFELAKMLNELPLSLIEKQAILSKTIKTADISDQLSCVKRSLKEYLSVQHTINLEGFMRFRMQQTRHNWKLSLQRAAEELLLEKEYIELMGILRSFVQLQSPRIRELSVCLNSDGTCTLTDDSDYRIDYADATDDGLVSVLISLAPERLTVYDLSNGACAALTEALARVFAGRIRFFL